MVYPDNITPSVSTLGGSFFKPNSLILLNTYRMHLINQVYNSLKWKRSDAYCAAKLEISLEEYQKLKAQILVTKNDLEDVVDEFLLESIIAKIEDQPNEALLNASKVYESKVVEFKENLEEGTAEIKGVMSVEPKSPEEIIQLLKIDTSKWKLSSYWNKEHKGYWLVSAMVSQKKSTPIDYIKNVLDEFVPIRITSSSEEHINYKFTNKCAAVLSIQDLHFGKEGNKGVVEDFKNAIQDLILRAYMSHRLEKVIYVIGGDLLNMDTFSGQTTKGTPLDNEQRAQDAYAAAFEALHWSIQYLAHYCKELEVVYIPGNHDRLSSYHIAYALSKCFSNPKITFHCDYSERKVIQWGNNMFAFEHGDVNSKNTALVYATEYATIWGSTIYRTCYTGHWHKKKTTSYVSEDEHHGFAIKHLPSLSRTDYWHYHNKFTGAKRQAVIELHDFTRGKVSELTYNP